MANWKSGGVTSSHNYNFVTNNKNTIENSKWKLNLLRQAKLDLLDSMNFENTLVNRNNLANQISENRKQNWLDGKNIWIPGGNIMIRKDPDISVNIDLDSYGMKWEYERLINEINNLKINWGDWLEITKREKKLRELDSVLAERCILDAWGSIEFRSTDVFESERSAKDESKEAYNELNKLDAYKWKIELISKKKAGVDFYVIKWTQEQIKEIKQKYEELLRENSKNENEKNNNEWEDKEKKDSKKENEKNKEMEALIKKLMEDSEEKDKKIQESEARIIELEKLLKNKDKKSRDTDSDEEITDEKNDKNDDKLEDTEALDENSNYISRSFVEWLLYWIRCSEWYPKWTIRIREEVINVEELEFYKEFKQEYIEAKWDAAKLSRLDKEFAEMIILFSPKWADYKDKYCIKLTESELKDGLYVSDERLARYGVMIKVSDYFEKIVEREVIRERKIIEQIETTITELQTQIVELTTSISIEKYNKETILKEIRSKKKLLAILIKRYKALQLSLRWLNNNDEELKKLREEESRLQKQLKNLNKQKNIFNEIKKALDSIPENEIVRINTKDWKTCKLAKKWKTFGVKHDTCHLFDDIKKDGNIKEEILLEILQNSGNIKEIIIWQEYMPNKQKKFSIPDIKNIDKKIADIKGQLADIQEKIKQKETSDKKRISLWEFNIWENWHLFRYYCKRNWIKRKDWKPFDENSLESDYMDIEYVDKNGRILKLEYIDWAEDDLYDVPQTKAEFVYYEESWNWERSELEVQLTLIIEEWEALLVELTELERNLTIAKTEEERIEIKKKIKIINKKLVIISQKYTKFEEFIHIYKSRIVTKKYSIYQIVPIEPIPVPDEPFKMTSVISDMGTDVFREKAALKVEEELKRQYKSLWRWQMWSRLALFLWRWSKRKKMMKNEMKNMANTAFQTDAAYATLNEQSQNAADRHEHELLTSMDAVNRITTVHNVQIDQLCKDYLNGRETDSTFQTKFNTIVAADANIQNALNGQNITHIWTNIFLQLKEQKALNNLIHTLDWQLSQYITTGNAAYMHNMQNFVEQYIKDYQKTPAFMSTFEQFVNWNLNARNRLRAYLSHQKAIMKMQVTNLTMNIDILNKGKSAYQIDNKDREKWWKYKVGHFLDKHPRGTAAGSVALAVWLWVATAWASAVAWAAITTWVFGSYVWFTNYIKKWTHHTKEQNTHEKNVVTDYRNEQAKIQNWQNTALNGRWWKKYKAKRQLALYDQTTQADIQLSNQISEYITNLSSKIWTLTPNEDNFMRLNLIEWWARLKYYRAMGHNFLASEKVDETEKDMRRLEKAITLWLQKIGKTTNDIEQNMSATNTLGTNITYAVIQNDLKASYDKSLIQFKRERRWLALRYGIWTAAVSMGAALGLQYLTWTWIWAWKDVPPTPWTPGTPSSTTNYVWWTDNFALSWDNLSTASWQVYNSTKSAITSSWAPTWSELTFNYAVWTDGTRVIWSFDPSSKFTALTSDFANTSLYPNLSHSQVSSLQTELSKIMSDPAFVAAFKDSDLAKMRAMESLEHFARALNDSARPDLILHFNHTGSIPGVTPHTLGERFMTWAIDITTPEIPWIPWDPWKKAARRWRWLMWVPLFFNTFKDRDSKKDTTDQNFGSNAQWNQQQQQQNP